MEGSGYNYETLLQWADSIRAHLLTYMRIKEVTINARETYYKSDYMEYHLAPNLDYLAQQQIPANYLFYVLPQIFVADNRCGVIWNDGRPEAITLNTLQSEKYDIWSLLNRPVEINGRLHKLGQLCTLEKMQAPQEIVKTNQQYNLCVQFEYIGSSTMGQKAMMTADSIYSARLPIGYSVKSGQNYYSWGQEDSRQYWLLGLVIAIIFFTTSILFNSLRLPLVIISVIPVSYVGLFLTFFLFGLNFDQGGFAALILLCGITVNASIYIVDEYRQYLRRSPDPKKALVKAFSVKIIPILLTILSTILGFIPFMVGDGKEAFWFPLAAGTIGGLVMSLVGIVAFLPGFLIKRGKLSRRHGGHGE
jgi:multidrug efflux pump subunit AcrB